MNDTVMFAINDVHFGRNARYQDYRRISTIAFFASDEEGAIMSGAEGIGGGGGAAAYFAAAAQIQAASRAASSSSGASSLSGGEGASNLSGGEGGGTSVSASGNGQSFSAIADALHQFWPDAERLSAFPNCPLRLRWYGLGVTTRDSVPPTILAHSTTGTDVARKYNLPTL